MRDGMVPVRVPAHEAKRERAAHHHGSRLAVLTAVACGGAVGGLARYLLALTFPHRADAFPWATFMVNVTGCALIGAVMAVIDRTSAHRLVRPFLGVGVLGSFTTFSTHILQVQQAASAGAARLALLYLAGTLVAALIAVWAGSAVTLGFIQLTRLLAHAMARSRTAAMKRHGRVDQRNTLSR